MNKILKELNEEYKVTVRSLRSGTIGDFTLKPALIKELMDYDQVKFYIEQVLEETNYTGLIPVINIKTGAINELTIEEIKQNEEI